MSIVSVLVSEEWSKIVLECICRDLDYWQYICISRERLDKSDRVVNQDEYALIQYLFNREVDLSSFQYLLTGRS